MVYNIEYKIDGVRIMSVHCTLSTLMGKHRYSIQDMHDKTGLSRNTISNLYNDRATRVDYETIDKLCMALDCTISELFDHQKQDYGREGTENNG